MPNDISYAAVARSRTVLAEESSVSGNANMVARKLLEKLPTNNTRVSYAQEGQLFHVLLADGLTFLCMADEPLGRRVPFAFLEDIKQRFVARHEADALSAAEFGLNDDFSPELAERMDFYSNDPSADAINRVRGAVADVKQIMVQNIENVLERGERIELLVFKTDALQSQAFSFRRESRRLKNAIFWKNIRMAAGIFAAVLLILYVLVSIFCSPTFHC